MQARCLRVPLAPRCAHDWTTEIRQRAGTALSTSEQCSFGYSRAMSLPVVDSAGGYHRGGLLRRRRTTRQGGAGQELGRHLFAQLFNVVMLRRLSEYKLGIFAPHMHDEHTGKCQPLPDELMRVEPGVEVSFQPTAEIAHQRDRYLPVGLLWRAGASMAVVACDMVCEEGQGDTERQGKYKMFKSD